MPLSAPASRVMDADADAEGFRLLTGFNDIFVSLAILLVLGGAGWFGGRVSVAAGGVVVAMVAWGLAEHFTRRRRMALPSLVLLAGFGIGVGCVAAWLARLVLRLPLVSAWDRVALEVVIGSLGGAAALAHWMRFRVPATVALGTLIGFGTPLLMLGTVVPGLGRRLDALLLGLGLAMFAVAMRWDMRDRLRRTYRADVAFWLHLLAAPLVVLPLFNWLGLSGTSRLAHGPHRLEAVPAMAPLAAMMIVVLAYLLLGLVAVIVDRRAALVSGLGTLLHAVWAVFREAGSPGTGLGLTALLVGGVLLALSVFWQPIRRVVLDGLPAALRERVPPPAGLAPEGLAPEGVA